MANEINIVEINNQEIELLEIENQVVVSEQGARGLPGSQIFKGSGDPLDSLGSPGDYYLDTHTYNLYGPKLGTNSWNLDSYTPLQGKDGKSFLTGVGSPSLSTGNLLDTYLDTASGNLYQKTQSGWVVTANIINQNEISYRHEQQSALSTWTINHNLGFKPNVNISDYGGNNVECDIEQVSTNQMVLLFAEPISGYAYLS
jgi:hypothetical protein